MDLFIKLSFLKLKENYKMGVKENFLYTSGILSSIINIILGSYELSILVQNKEFGIIKIVIEEVYF